MSDSALTVPESGSLAVPDTLIMLVVRICPFVGLVIATVGGVVSMLTVSATALDVETFPAAS